MQSQDAKMLSADHRQDAITSGLGLLYVNLCCFPQIIHKRCVLYILRDQISECRKTKGSLGFKGVSSRA